jgi:hypothetical protein
MFDFRCRTEQGSIETLEQQFPLVDAILNKYPGRIIVAGGAIARCIRGRLDNNHCDLDFFFIAEDPNLSNEAQIDQIEDMLKGIKEIFDETADQISNEDAEQISNEVYHTVTTDRFTTFVRTHEDCNEQYQFITARMYASPLHVIGGFDIQLSQCYYDGREIRMTDACAFCMASNSLILDPGCRSTSYEMRLWKYCSMGPQLLFPFADPDEIRKLRLKAFVEGVQYPTVEIVKNVHIGFYENNAGFLVSKKQAGALQTEESDYGSTHVSNINTYLTHLLQSNIFTAVSGKFENFGLLSYPTNYSCWIPPTLPNMKKVLGVEKAEQLWKQAAEVGEISMERYDRGQLTGSMRNLVTNLMDEAVKKPLENAITYAKNRDRKQLTFYGPRNNPGRQHTASFDPRPADISNYYTIPFKPRQIGIPHETYFILKCAMLRDWGCVMKVLMNHILTILAYDMLRDFHLSLM